MSDVREGEGDPMQSAQRHALRNKLAAMRNATFFVRKKLDKLGVLTSDARIAEFLGIIEAEIREAEGLLVTPPREEVQP